MPFNFVIAKVIVSSYMAGGGAGFEVLRTKRTGHMKGTVKAVDMLIQYINARTPLLIETGSRIIIKRSTKKINSTSQKRYSSLLLAVCLTVAIVITGYHLQANV